MQRIEIEPRLRSFSHTKHAPGATAKRAKQHCKYAASLTDPICCMIHLHATQQQQLSSSLLCNIFFLCRISWLVCAQPALQCPAHCAKCHPKWHKIKVREFFYYLYFCLSRKRAMQFFSVSFRHMASRTNVCCLECHGVYIVGTRHFGTYSKGFFFFFWRILWHAAGWM